MRYVLLKRLFSAENADRIILLADRRDGKSLIEKGGPLRIVVPDEKRRHGGYDRSYH